MLLGRRDMVRLRRGGGHRRLADPDHGGRRLEKHDDGECTLRRRRPGSKNGRS